MRSQGYGEFIDAWDVDYPDREMFTVGVGELDFPEQSGWKGDKFIEERVEWVMSAMFRLYDPYLLKFEASLPHEIPYTQKTSSGWEGPEFGAPVKSMYRTMYPTMNETWWDQICLDLSRYPRVDDEHVRVEDLEDLGPIPVWCLSCKYQLLDAKKVSERKGRLFSTVSVGFNDNLQRFTDQFKRSYLRAPLECGCGVGLDFGKGGMTRLVAMLCADVPENDDSFRVWMTDLRKYDKKFHRLLLALVERFMSRYAASDITRARLRYFFLHLAFKVVAMYDWSVFQVDVSNPSGSAITTIQNQLGHQIINWLAWAMACATETVFKATIACTRRCLAGDDLVQTKWGVASRVTAKMLTANYARLGFECKSEATVEERTFDNMTFLGARFRRLKSVDVYPFQWVPQYDGGKCIASLVKPVKWHTGVPPRRMQLTRAFALFHVARFSDQANVLWAYIQSELASGVRPWSGSTDVPLVLWTPESSKQWYVGVL